MKVRMRVRVRVRVGGGWISSWKALLAADDNDTDNDTDNDAGSSCVALRCAAFAGGRAAAATIIRSERNAASRRTGLGRAHIWSAALC